MKNPYPATVRQNSEQQTGLPARPLRFQGPKRYFINDLTGLLQGWQHRGIIQPDRVFLDVFGSSGLLSHHIKQAFPGHRVIWNDYDGYRSLIASQAGI